MASIPYRFFLNGADVCNLALEACSLSLRAGGPDVLSWQYAALLSGAAPHALHDPITVLCRSYNAEGEVVAEVTLFSGRVVGKPARDAQAGQGWTFTAENGWGDLKRVVMTQDWSSYDPVAESTVTRAVPRVVLGISAAGGYNNTGQIITEIIDHAAEKGANISAGTISPALSVPPTELTDTVCDAALRQMLAYHPDHVAWIESGTALNVRPPSALSTVTVDPCKSGLEVAYDDLQNEQPGGVVIVWERMHDVDGVQKIERIHQTAGSTSGWPPPIYMTIPLAGTNQTSKFERIETRTLPVAGETSAAVAKRFFKGLVPQLKDAATGDLLINTYEVIFADSALDQMDEEVDDTVNPNSKPLVTGDDEVTDFPRMLVSGQVQPWFPSDVKQYDAILKAKITYSGTDAAIREYVGAGLEIDEPIVITNALPKNYRVTDEITLAEEPIEGLAAAYWAAISGARTEGVISGPLAGEYVGLRPGRKVAVTGYFSTATPITATTYNLIDQTVSAEFGASEYLNPKSIAELARTMARNKPSWRRPEERTQALADSGIGGPIREGGKASKQNSVPYKSPLKWWDLEVLDATAGTVKIKNPGTVKKTKALDASGRVSITSLTATFTAVAGRFLVLEYLPNLSVTLKLIDQWPGWPMPIDSVESSPAGLWVMEKGYYLLWEFVASSNEVDSVTIKDGLVANRRALNDHLIFGKSWLEDKDGHVVPLYELLPDQGCRGAT